MQFDSRDHVFIDSNMSHGLGSATVGLHFTLKDN